ncbi:MAG: cupin domain-containing protein [Actinobacteria bacterium]|nr:cupin domain-containing protein [Actinomycetota bacterium]
MNNKKRPAGLPDWAGVHPFTPDKKKSTILDPKNDVITVYGSGREKISPRIFASTDKILMSSWTVPAGQTFQPPDIHSGDEPYYVLKGRPTIFNPETGQCIQAKEGDAILIPAKTWHSVFNFTTEEVVIVAIIEGPMWDESDIELVSSFKLKTIKYKGDES